MDVDCLLLIKKKEVAQRDANIPVMLLARGSVLLPVSFGTPSQPCSVLALDTSRLSLLVFLACVTHSEVERAPFSPSQLFVTIIQLSRSCGMCMMHQSIVLFCPIH